MNGTALEVIAKGEATPAHPVPLLFVHGAFHAAWAWDEHFLDFFAERGYRAVALSLRGHGRSPTDTPLRKCSIADYVADVTAVVDSLPTSPVLIGHSMGGSAIQRYLQSRVAPGAVLLASAPPVGQHLSLLRLNVAHPGKSLRALLTGWPSVLFASPELVRQHLFSPHTPEDVVRRTCDRLQEGSPRAIIADMALLALVDTKAVSAPMLVIGAEHDTLYPPKQVHATARAYHTQAHIIAGSGHDMMLDTEWPVAANAIAAWLAEQSF